MLAPVIHHTFVFNIQEVMQLTDLLTYAMEKYQISEDRKWAGFPGFSVLVEPQTGKWVALLMRGWNRELGEMSEKCDLRCGRSALTPKRSTFLTRPTRMHGLNWLGVSFNETTDAAFVYRLFDKAVNNLRQPQHGYTIILGGDADGKGTSVGDTLILPGGERQPSQDPAVPQKIREMQSIYDYGDGSFRQKCLNFCRQGQLMADYTDDEPWNQPYRHYFPTYHDLNVRQLRGYFTWRTNLRKGSWTAVPLSFAYLYLYELINGIGVKNVRASLAQMEAFEQGFIDAGLGDDRMREYLHRWMLELCVMNGEPTEVAARYADPKDAMRDASLAVLKWPHQHSDAAIFAALCQMAGKKEDFTPVVRNNGDQGRHLFAMAWRGADLFDSIFGQPRWYRWYPLSNAVYYEEVPHADCDYKLNDCRRYCCHDGDWQVECYEPLHFDRQRLQSFMRAADRLLRKYLKAGGSLVARLEEEWALPYVKAAIDADKREKIEATRPKISINLGGLEQIRHDADITRDSLLTEQERMEAADAGVKIAADPPTRTLSLNQKIISTLLDGGSVAAMLRERHLMPTIVADSINEEFFDAIGDNVVETDGAELTLIQDYREDLRQIVDSHEK